MPARLASIVAFAMFGAFKLPSRNTIRNPSGRQGRAGFFMWHRSRGLCCDAIALTGGEPGFNLVLAPRHAVRPELNAGRKALLGNPAAQRHSVRDDLARLQIGIAEELHLQASLI